MKKSTLIKRLGVDKVAPGTLVRPTSLDKPWKMFDGLSTVQLPPTVEMQPELTTDFPYKRRNK